MTIEGEDPDPARPPLPGEDGWSATAWPDSAVSGSATSGDTTKPIEPVDRPPPPGPTGHPTAPDFPGRSPAERPDDLPPTASEHEVSRPAADPAWPTSKGRYQSKELGPADRDPPEPPAMDRRSEESAGTASQSDSEDTGRLGEPILDGAYFGTDGSGSARPGTGPDTQSQPDPTATVGQRLQSLVNRLSGAAAVERLDKSFSLRHLFGSSFERRTQADVERELMVGTETTTPPLSTVRAEWPQPWLFARTLLASAVVLGLFFVGWSLFASITLLPGLIIVGSFAMPIAALIFFFEANIPRNVSIVAILPMVFFGGAASLVFSLIGFELLDFPWLGATIAGVVEEPAKILAVVLIARQARHRFILNGILFGAAVGAGFAAFESAGYALVAALFALDNRDVIDNIVLRGLLSPLGHVVWTAITAGALWRVKGPDRLRMDHVKDPRFWRIMVLAILLHTTWSSPIPSLLYIKYLALGAVAWLVCLSLLQEGIGQIRREQADLRA